MVVVTMNDEKNIEEEIDFKLKMKQRLKENEIIKGVMKW